MFRIVSNRRNQSGIDSTPVFKTIMGAPSYTINPHLGRATLPDDTTLIDDYVSQYCYKDDIGGEYRLKYTSMNPFAINDVNSVYLETIYGQLVPRNLYKVIADLGHWLVYAKEPILLLGGVLLRYDSALIENEYELINFTQVVSTDPSGESCEKEILLNNLPRLFIIGSNSIYNEHKIAWTNSAFSDGINLYSIETDNLTLTHAPVKLYKQYIFLPTPWNSTDTTGGIQLRFETASHDNIDVSVIPHSYDNYNNIILIKGLLNTITGTVFNHRTSVKATYKSPIALSNMQLNPILKSGRLDNSTPLRDKPIDVYLSGYTTSTSYSTYLFSREDSSFEIPEVITDESLKAFTIYFPNDKPDIFNVYNPSDLTVPEKEMDHYSGYACFDGISHDMSAVIVLRGSINIYNELKTRCMKYSTDPDIMASNFIRKISYQYAPVGRYVVVEFIDNNNNVVRRIV